jgi:hypothetical protein
MSDRFNKIALVQVVGSVLFLTQPIWLPTHPSGEAFSLLSRPTIRDFIANTLMLSFFFLNYFQLIPGLYFKRQYLLYGLLLVAGFLCICFLPSILTGRNPFESAATRNTPPPGAFDGNHSPPPPLPQGSTFYEEIKHHVFLFIAVVFFSLLLRIRSRLYEAETAKRQAELASLKSQINPHFLFNTLNSIYALVVKKDDKAADAVINLSELMRYIIKDANNDKIALQKELDYLNNYIELQSSRLGDTANIHFTITGTADNLTIAPLILISFIENAFKYGVNPDLRSDITIEIVVSESTLTLLVSNNKVAAGPAIASSGIGVNNTIDRLHLLYPSKHTLRITEDEVSYLVNLSIDLL